jgi:hypothetical protein
LDDRETTYQQLGWDLSNLEYEQLTDSSDYGNGTKILYKGGFFLSK